MTRFWSEKNLLVGPPAGPVPVAQDSLGYLLDGEQPPRRIARQIEGSDPPRYEIDRVVARAQFNELAPEAVRYTASMIDYIIRTENVQLCPPALPPLGEFEVTSVTSYTPANYWGSGELRFTKAGPFESRILIQNWGNLGTDGYRLTAGNWGGTVSGSVSPWRYPYCSAVSAELGGFFGTGGLSIAVTPSGVYLTLHEFGASWNVECPTIDGRQFVDDLGYTSAGGCSSAADPTTCLKLTEVRPGEYLS